ncbi:MAG TPA: hypothetical protein EYQ27_20450 [Gemmatimonadetes bacterium]|nr:hypothetical protein [Gemmatimonadota bacterium]
MNRGLNCVKGYFQRSRSDDRLRVDAIRGRRLYVDVIDDDEDPCPALYDTGTSSEWGYPADDPIAKSEPFSGDALAGSFGLALTFGDVSRIVLGTAAG